MSTVSEFEVRRYLGQWHQVAAIPAWFQSDCVAHTTANYAIGEDDQRCATFGIHDRAGQGAEGLGQRRLAPCVAKSMGVFGQIPAVELLRRQMILLAPTQHVHQRRHPRRTYRA